MISCEVWSDWPFSPRLFDNHLILIQVINCMRQIKHGVCSIFQNVCTVCDFTIKMKLFSIVTTASCSLLRFQENYSDFGFNFVDCPEYFSPGAEWPLRFLFLNFTWSFIASNHDFDFENLMIRRIKYCECCWCRPNGEIVPKYWWKTSLLRYPLLGRWSYTSLLCG